VDVVIDSADVVIRLALFADSVAMEIVVVAAVSVAVTGQVVV
jgi:hypothetical protein